MTTLMTIDEARSLESAAQQATLTDVDAWGRRRTVVVEWMPKILWGVDETREELDGTVGVAWADEPPVFLRIHQGLLYLYSHPVHSAGASGVVVASAHQVDIAAPLAPGAWRITQDD